jgi:hypothetical protein
VNGVFALLKLPLDIEFGAVAIENVLIPLVRTKRARR